MERDHWEDEYVKWVDNIKMYLVEIGWDGMVWTELVWLRVGINRGLL
jgi:hypothetical protein